MGDKTCNKCGYKGLGWDMEFHKKTGKWKLDNHRRQDGKWCNKPPESIMRMRRKHEIDACPYCFHTSNFGMFTKESGDLEKHIKAYHPSQEVLTDLDYKIMHGGLAGVDLKYWKSDPHHSKYEKR